MTSRRKTILAALAAVLLFLGVATAAHAGERAEQARRQRGFRALGLKIYWSLLDETQQDAAKAILADHLVATAPDRLEAFARLVRFRADVVAVLTPDQIRAAARMKREGRFRGAAERRAITDRLLDGTDRAALAARAEAHVRASPAEKVRLGIEMLGQLYDVMEPEVATGLELSAEQRASIRTLFEELTRDLEPIAVRLETAKAETAARAIRILDDDQRARLEQVRDRVVERVLDFLRG